MWIRLTAERVISQVSAPMNLRSSSRGGTNRSTKNDAESSSPSSMRQLRNAAAAVVATRVGARVAYVTERSQTSARVRRHHPGATDNFSCLHITARSQQARGRLRTMGRPIPRVQSKESTTNACKFRANDPRMWPNKARSHGPAAMTSCPLGLPELPLRMLTLTLTPTPAG